MLTSRYNSLFTYQTFSTDTVRFLGGYTSGTVCSEWEPTFLAIYQVETMRYVFILARYSTGSIWVF